MNYLSVCTVNDSLMEVDYELLLAHFKENGFRFMYNHTKDGSIPTSHYILWHSELGILCSLNTYYSCNKWEHNSCQLEFELESNDIDKTLTMLCELRTSHGMYADNPPRLNVKFSWDLRLKQPDSCDNILELMKYITNVGNCKFKPIWEGDNMLTTGLGTAGYAHFRVSPSAMVRQIIDIVPKDFQRFLYQAYIGTLTTLMGRYRPFELSYRIKEMQLGPGQIYVIIQRPYSKFSLDPASNGDRTLDLGVKEDCDEFIDMLKC